MIGYMAEKSLPLGFPSDLVKVIRELMKDPKAFESVAVERSTTTYKLTEGLAKTFQERTLQNMN